MTNDKLTELIVYKKLMKKIERLQKRVEDLFLDCLSEVDHAIAELEKEKE